MIFCKNVFKWDLKVTSESASLALSGREFHVLAPVWRKALAPVTNTVFDSLSESWRHVDYRKVLDGTAFSISFVDQFYLSPFARNSQSKCAWPCPLEWITVKYTYANGKALCDFLFGGNSNVFLSVTMHLPDIYSGNCAWPWTWPLERATVKCKNMPMERPYATLYLFAIAMFARYYSRNVHDLDLDL